MTLATRIAHAQHLLVAPCAQCRSLCSADPSMRVQTTCLKCGAVLQPRREVVGVSFRLVTSKAVASGERVGSS